jgi:hypothetical protein
MVAMSMNQLLGWTTFSTLGDMALGPTSWAIQTKGASSTMRAWSRARAASRSSSANEVRASAISASNSSLPK